MGTSSCFSARTGDPGDPGNDREEQMAPQSVSDSQGLASFTLTTKLSLHLTAKNPTKSQDGNGRCLSVDIWRRGSKATQTRTSGRPHAYPLTVADTPDVPDDTFSWDSFPSDVLLEVVSYVRDDRYALLGLTHVCNYWRQVLIECPLNWTHISTKYPPKLFRLWLQRSKGVPVDATICHLSPELYGGFTCSWTKWTDTSGNTGSRSSGRRAYPSAASSAR